MLRRFWCLVQIIQPPDPEGNHSGDGLSVRPLFVRGMATSSCTVASGDRRERSHAAGIVKIGLHLDARIPAPSTIWLR